VSLIPCIDVIGRSISKRVVIARERLVGSATGASAPGATLMRFSLWTTRLSTDDEHLLIEMDSSRRLPILQPKKNGSHESMFSKSESGTCDCESLLRNSCHIVLSCPHFTFRAVVIRFHELGSPSAILSFDSDRDYRLGRVISLSIIH
jgi:hypothetical protein